MNTYSHNSTSDLVVDTTCKTHDKTWENNGMVQQEVKNLVTMERYFCYEQPKFRKQAGALPKLICLHYAYS